MLNCLSDWHPRECPRGCEYTMRNGGCGYIFKEGHSRGCEPGAGCVRYRRAGAEAKKPKLPPEPKPRRVERRPRREPGWNVEAGKAMYLAGFTDAEIALELGISRRQVGHYRRNHWGPGIQGRALTWDVEAGFALYQAGYSDQEIALQLGTTRRNVNNMRKRKWEK